jgi:ubiquinone/menaquinone biosynthesis C-methylase UbiE
VIEAHAVLSRKCEPELMDDPREALAYARANFRDVNEKFVRDLLFHVGAKQVGCAVDLGCGPGDISAGVQRERPRWRIVAIDAAVAMLRLASTRIKAAKGVSLILARAQQLPLPAQSVDLVFSNSLLHHLPDPSPFWNEIGRITRPGGRVFVRDLMRPASEASAHDIVHSHTGAESALLQEEFYRSLIAAFTPDEIRFQLEAVGLGRLEVAITSDRHLDVVGEL